MPRGGKPLFTAAQDAEVARLYKTGMTTYEIADHLGVSPTPVTAALRRQGISRRKAGKRTQWDGSAETKAEVVKAYLADDGIAAISKRFHTRNSTIIAVLDEAGVSRWHAGGRPSLSPEQAAQAAALYESGMTLKAVGRQFDLSAITIRNSLRRQGVQIREANKPKFWTAERKAEAVRRYQAGESQQEIAGTLGCNQTGVSVVLREAGVAIRGRDRRGEAHPLYKGGRFVNSEGYVLVRATEEDRLLLVRITNNGYVFEHRSVMARALGRPLTDKESVHHINGDKQDNRLENLQLRSNNHGKGILLQCLDCGSHNVEAVPLT